MDQRKLQKENRCQQHPNQEGGTRHQPLQSIFPSQETHQKTSHFLQRRPMAPHARGREGRLHQNINVFWLASECCNCQLRLRPSLQRLGVLLLWPLSNRQQQFIHVESLQDGNYQGVAAKPNCSGTSSIDQARFIQRCREGCHYAVRSKTQGVAEQRTSHEERWQATSNSGTRVVKWQTWFGIRQSLRRIALQGHNKGELRVEHWIHCEGSCDKRIYRRIQAWFDCDKCKQKRVDTTQEGTSWGKIGKEANKRVILCLRRVRDLQSDS